MNSNGNRSFLDSNPNGFANADPGSSTYLNQQLSLNPGMQWSPQNSLFPPFSPQVQANGWPQQLIQQLPTQIPNGMPVGPSLPVQQQAPQFSNNLASLLPANILQDVFRMSVPVGSAPNDDSLLVQVLKDSVEKGQTYKQAIETLHGVNNHAANLWKDYYLDHKYRIDKLVTPPIDVPKTVKKPSPFMSPSHAQSNDSNRATSGSHATQARRTTVKKERDSPQPLISASKINAPSKRRTINSITAHEPTLNLKLLPPQADIKLPDPPSRCPTPPTKVVRGTHGNRYTQEDKAFFIKFLLWELQKDPYLTKHELCMKLAEKVPSHTVESWKSHWSGHHELADKIYASYQQRSPIESNGPESPVIISRPNYAEDSDSEPESKTSSSSDPESEVESIFDDLEELLAADSNDEGESGGSFTPTDMRNIVLFLADFPKDALIPWIEFQEKHPQRSDKSWQQFYRRNDKKINRYIRKYRKRQLTKSSTLPPQRGRPSWASSKMGPLPSALKRKVSSGDYDGNFKRMKEEDDLY